MNFIKHTFIDLLLFLRKPTESWELREEQHHHKFLFLVTLLVFGFIGVFLIMPLLEYINITKDADHKMGRLNQYSYPVIFLFITVLAPLMEETLFRLPLHYNRNFWINWLDRLFIIKPIKWIYVHYYTLLFYSIAIIFAVVHLSNFEMHGDKSKWSIILAVLPQLVLGILLGFVRNSLGFYWAILGHAMYNGSLALAMFVPYNETIKSIENKEYKFILSEQSGIELKKPKEQCTMYIQGDIVDSIIVKNISPKEILKHFEWHKTYHNDHRRINIEFRNYNRVPQLDSVVKYEIIKMYEGIKWD